MMGVDNVVACGFEFVAYFVVDYFVSLVGHAGIMYIGLLGYAIRFVVYASIRNPWTVLPVEALQGPLSYLSVFSACVLRPTSNLLSYSYVVLVRTPNSKIKFFADPRYQICNIS